MDVSKIDFAHKMQAFLPSKVYKLFFIDRLGKINMYTKNKEAEKLKQVILFSNLPASNPYKRVNLRRTPLETYRGFRYLIPTCNYVQFIGEKNKILYEKKCRILSGNDVFIYDSVSVPKAVSLFIQTASNVPAVTKLAIKLVNNQQKLFLKEFNILNNNQNS